MERSVRWGLAFAALWLALRVALWGLGGELGTAATVTVGTHDVAVLWFRDTAPRDTLLVVTHGGLASKETLSAVCWEARRRGADCVAVDALGHGASSAQPAVATIAEMRRALRVDESVRPAYRQVRFLGHSMGAFLGRGDAYPCGHSVALGQGTDCDDDRVVWGTLHRSLGLPESGYWLAHVLESWTPWTVRAALDRVLPAGEGSGKRLALWIALAWSSLGAAVAAGVSGAGFVRGCPSHAGSALRGILACVLFWSALAIGGWRVIWFLWPTQPFDFLVIGLALAPAILIALVLQAFPQAAPRTGTFVAVMVTLLEALVLFSTYRGREMGELLVLLPCTFLVLVPVALLLERLSRPAREDIVGSTSFATTLLALFLALLLPGF